MRIIAVAFGLYFSTLAISTDPARAEFWNNIGGTGSDEGRRASEAMFRSASELFAAMASFEALDEAAGEAALDSAIEAAFVVLENLSKAEGSPLAQLAVSPDAQTGAFFVSRLKDYGITEAPTSVAMLLASSGQVVGAYLSTLKEFRENQNVETYSRLRRNLDAALTVGELGSIFLQTVKP